MIVFDVYLSGQILDTNKSWKPEELAGNEMAAAVFAISAITRAYTLRAGQTCTPSAWLNNTQLKCGYNFVHHAPANSAGACCAMCTAHSNCTAWAWIAQPGLCNLKNGSSCQQSPHRGTTAGEFVHPAPQPPHPSPYKPPHKTPAGARNVLFIAVDDMRFDCQ